MAGGCGRRGCNHATIAVSSKSGCPLAIFVPLRAEMMQALGISASNVQFHRLHDASIPCRSIIFRSVHILSRSTVNLYTRSI